MITQIETLNKLEQCSRAHKVMKDNPNAFWAIEQYVDCMRDLKDMIVEEIGEIFAEQYEQFHKRAETSNGITNDPRRGSDEGTHVL